MNKENLKTILTFLCVFAAIYMFLVGINGMSSAIKHMGSGVAESIFTATKNPFIALFIGVFSTVLFQSSSTTTSLIVGMVSSGALSLSSSIPMVMGANIGTTVTNTIVSIGHISRGNEFKRAFAASTVHDFFNILAVIILFPLEITFHGIQRSSEWFASLIFGKMYDIDVLTAKSPIKAAVKSGSKFVEKFSFDNDIFFLIISILITFLMLYSLVKLLKSLVLEKIETFFDKYIFKTSLRAGFFGVILTIMVQSSSITTSLVVPLAGAGVLTLRQIFPFTLGANIGTTVTALLASLTGTVSALITAISHLIFNIIGILIIYGIPLLRNIPLRLAELISDYAEKNKLTPIIYLLITFILIPLSIIFLSS
ncbi:MAG: Na/Pi symporter [Candidatus Marinimicrobia bacterium]|jgi:sodium-dependent phosphate cotransporter|nr:Na/Pi symporter [Candidatus Neomarinimicrobiota bacterium]